MKSLFRFLVCVLLLGSLAGVVIEWKTIAKLRQDNQRLEKENDELFRFGKEQIEVEIGKREKELAQLRAQAQELPRLRGEVTQLRTAAKDLEKLRTENQQLRAAAKPNAPAAPPPPPASDTPYHAKESWAFAGYANPEAALQSMLWAMREGDLKSVLAVAAPEERARLEEQIAKESEAKLLEGFKKNASSLKGFRVLDRENVSTDAIALTVYPDDGEDKVGKLMFKRIGNEWKFAGKAQKQPQP